MDVKSFTEKFSEFYLEPQTSGVGESAEESGESKFTSLPSVEHLHYNWLVRRALYKWRKNERDNCLQERLRMTYRPYNEKKNFNSDYRIQPRQNEEIDLSPSVEIVPIRRSEDNKKLKRWVAQRKQILRVKSLQQGVKHRIARVRYARTKKGSALVADLHDGKTIFLPSSFTSLPDEEMKFLSSGHVTITYNGRIGGMDIVEIE